MFVCFRFAHGGIGGFMQAAHAKGAPGLGAAKSIPVLGDACVFFSARTHVFQQEVESYPYNKFFHFFSSEMISSFAVVSLFSFCNGKFSGHHVQ